MGPEKIKPSKKRIVPWALFLPLMILSSCSLVFSDPRLGDSSSHSAFREFISGRLRLIEGTYFNSRSRYAEAISSYLAALEYPGAAPYAEYDLGALYLSLDEGAAALERFDAAEKALEALPSREHGELLFRINYNRGVAQFQAGDYDAAASSFRKALETDHRRIEAKRNLELSLLSINREETESSPQGDRDQGGEESSLLFEYIRQREQDKWKSVEWIEENIDPGLDY